MLNNKHITDLINELCKFYDIKIDYTTSSEQKLHINVDNLFLSITKYNYKNEDYFYTYCFKIKNIEWQVHQKKYILGNKFNEYETTYKYYLENDKIVCKSTFRKFKNTLFSNGEVNEFAFDIDDEKTSIDVIPDVTLISKILNKYLLKLEPVDNF